MDYWKALDLHHHDNWEAFLRSGVGPKRILLFSTHGEQTLWQTQFEDEDGLLFGREADGCPDWLHNAATVQHTVAIPRFNDLLRSLNLATAVGIATYEALRQLHTRGLAAPLPDTPPST